MSAEGLGVGGGRAGGGCMGWTETRLIGQLFALLLQVCLLLFQLRERFLSMRLQSRMETFDEARGFEVYFDVSASQARRL